MFDAFDSPLSRRGYLSVVAGTALAVFLRVPARAQQELIGRLHVLVGELLAEVGPETVN